NRRNPSTSRWSRALANRHPRLLRSASWNPVRRNAQFVGHSHELRERPSLHLPHDLAAMHTDRDLARTEIAGGLLVQKACNDEGQDFTFPGSQPIVVRLQHSLF